MTFSHSAPEHRVAIWSLSPKTLGAYFAIFLVQYIPGIAFEAYTLILQSTVSETVVHTALAIVRASGPIGIGSAMNAIAVALSAEAVMVLARMLSRQQREEGFRQGVMEERKRSNAKLRALAKEYGIPEDKLPLAPEDDE